MLGVVLYKSKVRSDIGESWIYLNPITSGQRTINTIYIVGTMSFTGFNFLKKSKLHFYPLEI
ncbi:hypothetical protein HanRHA438_Chr09g0394171 [Helianthus annuus]|nr:hypothetical protein HanRHA438_Chr09g0394171 [Helianthus annuus]